MKTRSLVLATLVSAGCDVDIDVKTDPEAREDVREAGQELREDMREAGQELRQGVRNAGAEIRESFRESREARDKRDRVRYQAETDEALGDVETSIAELR